MTNVTTHYSIMIDKSTSPTIWANNQTPSASKADFSLRPIRVKVKEMGFKGASPSDLRFPPRVAK